jgi:hypothetical protein
LLTAYEEGPAADIDRFDRLTDEHVRRERDRLIKEGVLAPEPPPDLLAWIARAIQSLPD